MRLFSRVSATTPGLTIYCWLSTSAPTARPSYVMPGGAKKEILVRGLIGPRGAGVAAVFPTMTMHDHEQVRDTATEHHHHQQHHQQAKAARKQHHEHHEHHHHHHHHQQQQQQPSQLPAASSSCAAVTRGKSTEGKESPEKEKGPPSNNNNNNGNSSSSSSKGKNKTPGASKPDKPSREERANHFAKTPQSSTSK
ncbi:hypothetical protein B566_EDAN011308 [Ephemera danica]|nr:hypothetical protein B566_EDAN011308 [Ephemera danica]